MSKKIISALLSIVMISTFFVFHGSNISAAANEENFLYLRTDSVQAHNAEGTAKILFADEEGVSIVNEGFISGNTEPVLKLQKGSAVLQFDLPANSEGAQLRLLGELPGDSMVVIETSDGAYKPEEKLEDISGNPQEGVHIYEIDNFHWVDNEKRIRIKICGGSTPVYIYAAAIFSGNEMAPSDGTVTVKPLDKSELLYAVSYDPQIRYYMHNGNEITLYTNGGRAVYSVCFTADCTSLKYDFDGIPGGDNTAFSIEVKDAGSAGEYTAITAKVGEITGFSDFTLFDPDGIENSGDEYRKILIAIPSPEKGQNFLKYFSLKPEKLTFNPNATDSTYLRIDAVDATNQSGTAKIYPATESGVSIANEGFISGNSEAVVKLQNGNAVLQFDLPANSAGGQLRLLGELPGDSMVVIETPDGAYKAENILKDISGNPQEGVYIYEFDNFYWVDNQKRIRVKIFGGNTPVYIHSAAVINNGEASVSDGIVTVTPLSKSELLYAENYDSQIRYYMHNNETTLFTNGGAAVYSVRFKVNYAVLAYDFDGVAGNGNPEFSIEVKDAGSESAYITVVEKAGEIYGFKDFTVFDPDGIENSGDEYREILVKVPSPSIGQNFLKYFSLKPQTLKFDINSDGKESSADMVVLRKILLGNEEELLAADFNGDNVVDILDFILLKKYLVKL